MARSYWSSPWSVPNATIRQALQELGVDVMPNSGVQSITDNQVELADGRLIESRCIIWTTGMKANPLVQQISSDLDGLGRARVDKFLSVVDDSSAFVAGDAACAEVDAEHDSMMSCQHARPMGRIAGYNAVASLYDRDMIEYHQPEYVTCLDLGSWGALFMQGWDRQIDKQRAEGKAVKQGINHERIRPPKTVSADALFELAKPVIHAAPK